MWTARRTRLVWSGWLLLLAATGCADPASRTGDGAVDPSRACNGSELLCDRRFDQVAYATTHNAMSNEDDGWISPNQLHGITRQLVDGVRGLMLDIHYEGDEVFLCHGFCAAGSLPLVDGLAELREFLDAQPREVITIIFESYVSAADTAATFSEAGLDGRAHAQDPADPWPTLGELINAGTPLVVFTDHEGGTPDWYLPVWDHCFETHYHFESAAELSCDVNRGDPANALFILNHFLTNPVAHPSFAEELNVNPLLLERARSCEAVYGHLPNFVTVDFYSIGALFAVVDALNGVTP
ncbi:MAG: hypothetical protein ABI333_13510 [bacterium]